MKAMLLAAGEGSRFKPYTLKMPKPALPFLNVPLAFYAVEILKSLGVTDIVANTFHLPGKIVECLKPLSSALGSLQFSHEKTLLGSGGGLWNAKDHFLNDDDLILMNADEVILPFNELQLRLALEQHQKQKNISTLIVTEHPEVGSKFGGVWVNDKNQVIGFGKTRPINAVHGYHFIGLQFLSRKIFDYLPEGESNILLNGVLEAIQHGQKVQIQKIDCHWFETGNLQDYLLATEQCLNLLKNETSPPLKKLLSTYAPESQLIENQQHLIFQDSSSRVSMNQIKGFAVLGARSQAEKEAQLTNCVLATNAHVSHSIKNELIL